MQLVIKDGLVIAAHDDHQQIAAFYPDADEIICVSAAARVGDSDPRTDEQKSLAYRDRRRIAYPPIGDQLDMIFWDQVNGTTKWREMITEIKNRIRP